VSAKDLGVQCFVATHIDLNVAYSTYSISSLRRTPFRDSVMAGKDRDFTRAYVVEDMAHEGVESRRELLESTGFRAESSGTGSPAVPKRQFRSQKALVQAHKKRVAPELREEDLEETFVRGSGPGGQATNKTSNNVSLIHKPTGIRVTCHKTRSQATNRRIARRILLEKLDQLYNPGITREDIEIHKKRDRKRQKAKKARKKQRQLREHENGNDAFTGTILE